MDISNPFYLDILKAFNQLNVRYILIGGLAVSYHGYSRYTGDMDLWIEPEPKNIERLYKSLIEIGYPEGVVANIRKQRDIENPTPIKLKDDNNYLKIDLITNTFQKEISWRSCYQKSEIVNLPDVSIPIIHIDHLIQMKENTKRLDSSMKDLVDAQELKKILTIRKTSSNKKDKN